MHVCKCTIRQILWSAAAMRSQLMIVNKVRNVSDQHRSVWQCFVRHEYTGQVPLKTECMVQQSLNWAPETCMDGDNKNPIESANIHNHSFSNGLLLQSYSRLANPFKKPFGIAGAGLFTNWLSCFVIQPIVSSTDYSISWLSRGHNIQFSLTYN